MGDTFKIIIWEALKNTHKTYLRYNEGRIDLNEFLNFPRQGSVMLWLVEKETWQNQAFMIIKGLT